MGRDKNKKEQDDKAAHRRMGAAYQQLREGNAQDLYLNRIDKDGNIAGNRLDFYQNPMQAYQTPTKFSEGSENTVSSEPMDLSELRKNPHSLHKQTHAKERKLVSHTLTGSGSTGRKGK